MKRPINFNPGPAALPDAVLARIREELTDWRGSGMSVMEMSHRGPEFTSIAEAATAALRGLMEIPDDHAVLFLQGGASGQFAAIPLNLCPEGGAAAYVETGAWSRKAVAEARRFCEARLAASGAAEGFASIPDPAGWDVRDGDAYLHYTPNETVGGVEFHSVPEGFAPPLVADMSSTILSRPVPVERFGVIYAGAQKNLGVAGLTVVVVRRDLLDRAREATPSFLTYRVQADADSMANTPPTFAWYVAGLVFQWLEERGGLAAMAEQNRRQAETLYRAIDGSGFYENPVAPAHRSWMNVPFTLADPALDARFLERAREAGMVGLAGHRSVGGMRASLYNAMPDTGVSRLVEVMAGFEREFG